MHMALNERERVFSKPDDTEKIYKADLNLIDKLADAIVEFYETEFDTEVVVTGHIVNDTKFELTYVNPNTLDTNFIFWNTRNMFVDWSDNVDFTELLPTIFVSWITENNPVELTE